MQRQSEWIRDIHVLTQSLYIKYPLGFGVQVTAVMKSDSTFCKEPKSESWIANFKTFTIPALILVENWHCWVVGKM